MKWVVLAIILFIIPYTYLTLKYRKPGKAFEPYHDMKERANTLRLLQAGYQRIEAEMTRPAEQAPFTLAASTEAKPGGVTPDLKATLLDSPRLPAQVESVRCPAIITSDMPCPVEFTCVLADEKHEPLDAQVYVRSSEVVILPNFEKIAEGLSARSDRDHVRITLPAHALKPGSYRVILVGESASVSWALQVH